MFIKKISFKNVTSCQNMALSLLPATILKCCAVLNWGWRESHFIEALKFCVATDIWITYNFPERIVLRMQKKTNFTFSFRFLTINLWNMARTHGHKYTYKFCYVNDTEGCEPLKDVSRYNAFQDTVFYFYTSVRTPPHWFSVLQSCIFW